MRARRTRLRWFAVALQGAPCVRLAVLDCKAMTGCRVLLALAQTTFQKATCHTVGAGGERAAWRAGIIEYWSATTLKQPAEGLAFRFKLDTDLYALAKAKTAARSLEVSRDGAQFSVVAADRRAALRVVACHDVCCTRPPPSIGPVAENPRSTQAPARTLHAALPGPERCAASRANVVCAAAGACACSAS
jgi:hypothetical protein